MVRCFFSVSLAMSTGRHCAPKSAPECCSDANMTYRTTIEIGKATSRRTHTASHTQPASHLSTIPDPYPESSYLNLIYTVCLSICLSPVPLSYKNHQRPRSAPKSRAPMAGGNTHNSGTEWERCCRSAPLVSRSPTQCTSYSNPKSGKLVKHTLSDRASCVDSHCIDSLQ